MYGIIGSNILYKKSIAYQKLEYISNTFNLNSNSIHNSNTNSKFQKVVLIVVKKEIQNHTQTHVRVLHLQTLQRFSEPNYQFGLFDSLNIEGTV